MHRFGSPSFSLNKTPAVVGGRLEQFGNILSMISRWEEMEGKEEEEGRLVEMEKGRWRRNRSSQKISELRRRFEEEGVDEDTMEEYQSSQTGVGEEGGGEMIFKSWIEFNFFNIFKILNFEIMENIRTQVHL